MKFIGITLSSSEFCNLNCKYCYHPHYKKEMVSENNKIIQWFKEGKLFENLKRLFPNKEDFTSIALWGGEPSFNFKYEIEEIRNIVNHFPNFEEIGFSTNLSTDYVTEQIINFITEVLKIKSTVKIKVQVSIDGPSFINDINRDGASVDKILVNLNRLNKFYINNKQNIVLYYKATLNKNNIKELTDNDELFYNYFKFFEGKMIGDRPMIPSPTYEYPGSYTVADGKVYGKWIHKLLYSNHKFDTFSFPIYDQTTIRLLEIFRAVDRIRHRTFMDEFMMGLSCSAGNSVLGFDKEERIHWCQSTFWYNDRVIDIVSKDDREKSVFEANGGYDFKTYRKYIEDKIIARNEPIEYNRLKYIMKASHLNNIFTFEHMHALIFELAKCGHISKIYGENEVMRKMLVMLSMPRCFVDNAWVSGDIGVNAESLVKFIGNGAFETITKFIGERNG